MSDSDILILRGQEAIELMIGREQELIEIVRKAYDAHSQGNSSLPLSPL